MVRGVRIGERIVGPGAPVFVIAEIGLNHNGDPALARELIGLAAAAGADAIKFQKRSVDRCFTRAALNAPYAGPNSFGATYGEHKQALELSEADYWGLLERSRECGVTLLVTPFDEESADLVGKLDCPAFKIASHNLTNLPLLEHVARMGRPILLSTGMADMTEVEQAVATICRHHQELVLLQCTSAYPARVEELNLHAIETYRQRFGCPVGYSAHEAEEVTLYAAVALGACVVEKHFTKDKTLKGPDHATSFEPHELKRVIEGIRIVSVALGSGEKVVSPGEWTNRVKHHRSIVSAMPIPKGTTIREGMLTTKAPGTGLEPRRIWEIIGRRTRLDIAEDTTMTTEMLD